MYFTTSSALKFNLAILFLYIEIYFASFDKSFAILCDKSPVSFRDPFVTASLKQLPFRVFSQATSIS